MKKSFLWFSACAMLLAACQASPLKADDKQTSQSGEAPKVETAYQSDTDQRHLEARSVETIKVDGLEFKDLNKDGELTPYEDWRLKPEERAENLVSLMSPAEKAGQMVIYDLPMGLSAKEGEETSHDGVLLEVEKVHEEGPFKGQTQYPTSVMINDKHIRHFIVREDESAEDIATWVNTLQEVAEESPLGIPVIVASNSRNENDKAKFNAESDSHHFTRFPGTLGLAAGDNLERVEEFAQIGHQEFLASNIRKGYMYMVDTATDPRWYRTYGTFGENPDQISDYIQRIIPAYQGESLNENSIALTTKHFPGGGARENGFDPHYEEGKFNVYATEGSLETYHLPPFQAAVDAGTSSIMPYYAIPSNDKSYTPQAPFKGDFEEEIAFAYNHQFIQDLLRDQMGFEGYINTDTGVLDGMAWGAEDLDKVDRAAKMLQAGSSVVSGTNEVEVFQEAIESGKVDESTVNQRLVESLTELFQLGLFEDPYVETEGANDQVRTAESLETAQEAHHDSVVLLKNKDQTLPLKEDQVKGKKVYVELLTKEIDPEKAKEGEAKSLADYNADLRQKIGESFPGLDLVDDYHEADIALIFAEPVSGSYFEATDDYLDLQVHKETEVDTDHLKDIRDQVDQLVVNVNFDMPFIVDQVEPLADALTASFDTYLEAILDVQTGRAEAKGKLPLTLPANNSAVEVDDKGVSVSPNDVPGYDKEKHMEIPYAYKDNQGNVYKYGYGLTYKEN
ncbi:MULTISPECIES: glycoside hydrolase family 3 protein [Aerococcus]|nr:MULTISPECIES: glycoside hydrolase family 3 N-terminal domain-containing protein [Aerococcus]MDK6370136.1 glycoside hydrolase family 3 N-terminal domain-containing protein [Aerococcus sp. UMB9870]MDK6680650.1 glycoside hydrolase family 3 N-terminal domain-containing protein [Aerococcus sp. UMB8608]MDK6687562.1 glycoside hydrolase family 3 N-terminal domain-containing protein [Aerococcus sp. UMB8623]MDK6940600.1 glycoside hydrolase family 3 N-terminal domain-containing protein [Aerococcus sp. 